MQSKKTIASLALGIAAIVCVFFGFSALLGIALGVVGLVLGIKAKKEEPSGMVTAGIILSIFSIGLCLIGIIALVASNGDLANGGFNFN